jgi:hypothetical protein
MELKAMRTKLCSGTQNKKKIAHVNALRRHVGTAMLSNCLDKANILQEQERDAFCWTQTTPGSCFICSDFFLDNKGAMSIHQQI